MGEQAGLERVERPQGLCSKHRLLSGASWVLDSSSPSGDIVQLWTSSLPSYCCGETVTKATCKESIYAGPTISEG